MTEPNITIELYMVLHGLSTIGAITIFLIRNEHRITKLEVSHKDLKDQHNTLTAMGTTAHAHKP